MNRQAKWDRQHVRTASTRLPMEEYVALKAECAAEGTTVYALTQKLLRDWLALGALER